MYESHETLLIRLVIARNQNHWSSTQSWSNTGQEFRRRRWVTWRIARSIFVTFSDTRFMGSRQSKFLGSTLPCFSHKSAWSVPLVILEACFLLEFPSHKIGILSILIITLYDLINLVTVIFVKTACCKVWCSDMQSTTCYAVVLQMMMKLVHHRLCKTQPSKVFLHS